MSIHISTDTKKNLGRPVTGSVIPQLCNIERQQ